MERRQTEPFHDEYQKKWQQTGRNIGLVTTANVDRCLQNFKNQAKDNTSDSQVTVSSTHIKTF
jgi:hypothetical protein